MSPSPALECDKALDSCQKWANDQARKEIAYLEVADVLCPGIYQAPRLEETQWETHVYIPWNQQFVDTTKLTRRMVVAKTAEFFDPIGLIEPLKIILEPHLIRLNNIRWDKDIDITSQ